MKLSVNFSTNLNLPPKIAKTCTSMFFTTLIRNEMSKNPRSKLQDVKNQSFTDMPILAHSRGMLEFR